MRRFMVFVFGAAGGALIGATVAILMTPASGEDLRSDLRNRTQRFWGELQAAADERREELEQQLEAMRHPGSEIPLEKG